MSQKTSSSSHAETLKSTSIIGGSTALMLLIRMVRTKVLALLLGPSGVGLAGIFDSLISLARIVTDLGISSSGARQIAAATASGDERVIATTVITLRRVSLVLGLLGATLLFLFRTPLSLLTFESSEHATDIGVLAIILVFGATSGGQGALLQGMRRIRDLAKIAIIGTALGTLLTIPLVYVWGQRGIPAYMVVNSGLGSLVSFLYARRIRLTKASVNLGQIGEETARLMKLGVVFLSSGLMTMGVMYFVQVLITRRQGIDAVGQFQAANTLSTIYVGFILQAMGTDFYPRLTTVASDNAKCNLLVNEQAEVSLLLGLPGILGMLAFAPWLIPLFYSSRFDVATEILCWQTAGMMLRIICWPMAFIVLAKGNAGTFFVTELLASAVHMLLSWLGLRFFGLPGTGMAFLGLYVFYWILISQVVWKASGFRWSAQNARLSLIAVITVAIALTVHLLLPTAWAATIGGILTMIVGFHSLKALYALVGPEKINRYLQTFRLRFYLPPRANPPAKP